MVLGAYGSSNELKAPLGLYYLEDRHFRRLKSAFDALRTNSSLRVFILFKSIRNNKRKENNKWHIMMMTKKRISPPVHTATGTVTTLMVAVATVVLCWQMMLPTGRTKGPAGRKSGSGSHTTN